MASSGIGPTSDFSITTTCPFSSDEIIIKASKLLAMPSAPRCRVRNSGRRSSRPRRRQNSSKRDPFPGYNHRAIVNGRALGRPPPSSESFTTPRHIPSSPSRALRRRSNLLTHSRRRHRSSAAPPHSVRDHRQAAPPAVRVSRLHGHSQRGDRASSIEDDKTTWSTACARMGI